MKPGLEGNEALLSHVVKISEAVLKNVLIFSKPILKYNIQYLFLALNTK